MLDLLIVPSELTIQSNTLLMFCTTLSGGLVQQGGIVSSGIKVSFGTTAPLAALALSVTASLSSAATTQKRIKTKMAANQSCPAHTAQSSKRKHLLFPSNALTAVKLLNKVQQFAVKLASRVHRLDPCLTRLYMSRRMHIDCAIKVFAPFTSALLAVIGPTLIVGYLFMSAAPPKQLPARH